VSWLYALPMRGGDSAPPPPDVLFAMDTSGGAEPLAGFDGTSGDANLGVRVDRTLETSGGPTGSAAFYRFTFLYDATLATNPPFYGGEFYRGWGVDVGSAPSSGESRYTRIKFRVSGNGRAIDQNTGEPNGHGMQDKLLIIGDGAAGRTILSVFADYDGSTFDIRTGRDAEAQISITLTRNVWYSLQICTVCGNGGSVTVWVNNNTEGSPDDTATGINMGASQYDQVAVGYYANRMIQSSGSYVTDVAAFAYGTTFDNTWYVA
jgi:hypothetical protein